MKYEHTYLSVRVTATGNTAREMSRWSDAARTEYLRDQIVMFLNGRRPDFCVECVDLDAERLERRQVCAHTDGDLLGMADSLDALDEPEHAKECRKIVSDRKESARRGKELLERIKPTPTPAPQAGEWPEYWLPHDKSESAAMIRRSATTYDCMWAESEGGEVHTNQPWDGYLDRWNQVSVAAFTKWLRENGHAKLADELEGDRFEPVGVAPRAGDIVECVHASTYARNYKVGDKWELISTSDRSAYPKSAPFPTIGFPNCFVDGAAPSPRSSHFRILKRTAGN